MKKTTRILALGAVLTAVLFVTAGYAAGDGTVSSDAPQEVLIFTLFYGGDGKFLGLDMAETTLENLSQPLRLPLQNDFPDAQEIKIVVTDSDFRPLSADGASQSGGMGAGRDNETPIL